MIIAEKTFMCELGVRNEFAVINLQKLGVQPDKFDGLCRVEGRLWFRAVQARISPHLCVVPGLEILGEPMHRGWGLLIASGHARAKTILAVAATYEAAFAEAESILTRACEKLSSALLAQPLPLIADREEQEPHGK